VSVADWIDRALCREYTPAEIDHLWYSGAPSRRAKAAEICFDCPVRQQCLARALELPDGTTRHGVWAGHTEYYLRNLRSKSRRDVNLR
jgi:Transcription factor WhiB